MTQTTIKRAAATAAAAIALTATAFAAATPASATTNLGGLNLNAYCSAKYGTWPQNFESNPYYWVCVNPSATNNNRPINMNSACLWQYGSGAWAALAFYSPYGWRCYR